VFVSPQIQFPEGEKYAGILSKKKYTFGEFDEYHSERDSVSNLLS
jgi:hypothetical protein